MFDLLFSTGIPSTVMVAIAVIGIPWALAHDTKNGDTK